MATKQEEFNNLCTIRNALVDIEQLEKKRDDCKNQISEYESRVVEEYPEYSSQGYKDDIKSSIYNLDEKAKKVSRRVSLLTMIPSIIYGIFGGIKLLQAGNDSGGDMILYALLFFGPIFFAIIPYYGHVIAAVAHLLLGAFLSLSGEDGVIYRDIFFISAAILVGAYIIWWIAHIVLKSGNKKKTDEAYDKAAKLEAIRYAEYLEKKAVADVEIARKKQELKLDTETKCADLRQKMAEINQTIRAKKNIILQTPGLAEQDKNIYTIDTLITYFNRGKADSIKEAINLYDAEEHQKMMDRKTQEHLRMLQYQQNAAIMDMQEEQRRHNNRMADEQYMQNEAVKRRLDKINDKVDEYIDEARRNL